MNTTHVAYMLLIGKPIPILDWKFCSATFHDSVESVFSQLPICSSTVALSPCSLELAVRRAPSLATSSLVAFLT